MAGDDLAPETVAITAGRPKRRPDAPLNEAVTFASTFHAGGPVAYGRDGNPTWTAFEDALGVLEGGTALAFASGMAASMAVLDEVPIGGIVVAPFRSYYGTRKLLDDAPDGRWTVRFVDIADTAATLDPCDGADLFFVESPTNPLLEVADLAALSAGAHDRDVVVAVAEAVARSGRLIVHATSLGGIETTIERRGRWPGEETTPPALLRLSVGCENVDDLWRDLEHALRIGRCAATPGPTPVAFVGIVVPRPAPGEPHRCPMGDRRPV